MSRARTNYERYLAFKVNVGYKLNTKRSVWVPDEEEGYVKGEVQSESGGKLTILMGDGEKRTVDKKSCEDANPSKFDGVDDCAELSYLNDATVLHNLRVRYDEDLIHTYSGLFLVVVNPYKWIPIYTPEIIEIYQGKRRNEVYPHTFAVADQAYRDMMREGKNQSILITGESGAGKTENTKKVIQYLATIAGKASSGGKLEEQILEANPMLEAFGNAKTNKNDNSSRFGKFIRIQFNAGGIICGTTIEVYILEKSRVVHQGKGERSFHIFYQIIAGATSTQKKTYHIGKANTYGFFTDKSSNICKTLNDEKEWEHTNKAMKTIGLSDDEIDNVYRIVGGIMQCGNLKYKSSYSETASITTPEVLDNISEIWKVDRAKFEKSLIKPRVKAGTEVVEKHLNVAETQYSVQAMCKSIYERLFLWLVKKLNSVLESETENSFIGVLDIAGFEIFELNSFEQLCINYTNEKLQQFFNLHMFKLEQEEYAKEKIKWTYIDFGVDSRETIATIEEKNNSLLALLDEETIFPRASDESLIAKLHSLDKKHKKYQKVKFKKLSFSLGHYAGEVEYDVHGWIKKNKDPLQDDIASVITGSKSKFISSLFTDVQLDVRERIALAKKKHLESQGKKKKASHGSGASFMTVAQAYKDQLFDLMNTLGATEPHFIRCIIPNLEKRQGKIVCDLLLEQLRCNGVLEGIKISRKGYPNRIKYAEFVRRYYLLHPTMKRSEPEKEEGTKKIMEHNKKSLEGVFADEAHKDIEKPYWQFGISKIFFRHGVLAKLEEEREKKLASMVINIQAAARGWLGRRAYRNIGKQAVAAKILQKNIKTWLKFREWPWWKCYVASIPFLKKVGIDTVIADLEKKIADLEKEIAEAIADRDGLKESDADRKKRRDDLEDQLAALTEVVNGLKKDRESSQEKNDDLADQLDELRRSITALEEKNASGASDVKDNARTLEGLKDEIEEKNGKIAELEATKKAQQGEISEGEEKQNDLNDAISRLKKQVAQLETEIDEVKDEAEGNEDKGKGVKKNIDAVHSEKNDTQDEIDDVASAKSKLEGQNKELKSKIASAKEEVEEAQARVAAAKKANSALESDKSEAEDSLSKAEKAVSEQEKKNKAAASTLQDTKDSVEDANAAAAEREKKNKPLEEEIKSLKTTVEDLEETISDLEKAQRQNKTKSGDLNEEKEELEEAIQKVKKSLSSKQDELKEAEEALDEAERAKSALESSNKQLAGKVKDANEEAEDARDANTRLAKDAQKLNKQAQDLQDELEETEDGASKAKSEAARLRSEVEDLEGDLEDAEKSAKDLSSQVKELELELEDTKNEIEEEQEAKSKLGKGGDAELEEAQSRLDDAKSEQTELEDELASAKPQGAGGISKEEEALVAEAKEGWERLTKKLQNELDYANRELKFVEQSNRGAGVKSAKDKREEAKKKTPGLKRGSSRVKQTGPSKPDRKAYPEWVQVQKRTFTRWMNQFLVERMMKVEDLGNDLWDGIKLCNMLEVISGKKIRYNKNPRMRAQYLENCNVAIRFITNEGIRLVGIGAEDLVDPKTTLILGLMWTVILRYTIQQGSEKGSPKSILLKWVREKIGADTKYDCTVRNFGKDWMDGKNITALVNALSGGCKWPPSGSAMRDAKDAFDFATKDMGIEPLLLAEDMVNTGDELSNMTYIALFRTWEKEEGERRERQVLEDALKDADGAWEDLSDSLLEKAMLEKELFTLRNVVRMTQLAAPQAWK